MDSSSSSISLPPFPSHSSDGRNPQASLAYPRSSQLPGFLTLPPRRPQTPLPDAEVYSENGSYRQLQDFTYHRNSSLSEMHPKKLNFSDCRSSPSSVRMLFPRGSNQSTSFAKEMSDREHKELLEELRDKAEKVLEEDEWMLPSSDDILGFSDNFQNIDYRYHKKV